METWLAGGPKPNDTIIIMKKTVAAGLGVCAIAMAFAAKDPVIMTVNGVDVPRSEFEYLYNKNSQQQINPQTLDES